MRLSLTLPLFAFAAALALPPPASADWHKPYVYREGGSNWNTVQYDDGICRYYYSHNAYDDRTSLNKSGDCSHLAIGRTYLSAGAGYIAQATGWGWFFVVCALAGLPSLLLLAFLQRRGHFVRLVAKTS